MAKTEAKYPGTVTSETYSGQGDSPNWVNVNNIKTFNSIYAYSRGGPSQYLISTDYGFNIPTGSTINGVVVEINGFYGAYIGYSVIVSLIKGGIVSGGNKSADNTFASSAFTYTYGNSINLWGLSLTTEEVNASNFGVAFVSYVNNPEYYFFIDFIRVTVYYKIAPTVGTSNINPYTGKILTGKILTDTVTPKVRINGVLIDNKAHEMLMQPVTVLVTTRTEFQQAKGK